jgi:nicotinamidase-related amidase
MEVEMTKALIVVDMQVDFVTGSLGTKEAQAIVPLLCRKVQEETAQGTRVIFTKDTHEDNYLDTQEGRKLPVKHCIRNTEGWKLIPELEELAEEIVEKPAFGSIELPKLVADVDRIELVGLCTDICVISNALLLKAHFPEKIIQVDSTCCAGVTPDSHQNAIAAMKMCQIDIIEQENGQAAVEQKPEGKKVVIQTFGNFQMFVDEVPVKFSRKKSEELLAFLIDRRGAGVTNAEIASILFEDKEYSRSVKNQVQTIISQLIKTLREYGVEDILIRQWNSLAIRQNKVQCDYFDFLTHKKESGMMKFSGEYMSNYSWAEYTNGYLIQQMEGEC